MNRSIDIIVPIYRNADLTEACVRSLLEHIDELRDLSPRITLINDSPDDKDVVELLSTPQADAPQIVVHVNPENLGFVRSVNAGLAQHVAMAGMSFLSTRTRSPSRARSANWFESPALTRKSASSARVPTTLRFVHCPTFEEAGSPPHTRLTRTGKPFAGRCRPSTSARPASAFICSSHTRF